MKVSDLSGRELKSSLSRQGLYVRTGPITIRIQSPLSAINCGVQTLYGDHVLAQDAEFADFHVRVASPSGPRRWLKPQVLFFFDDRTPFKPLPLKQAVPLLEWGMNWCVANYLHEFLILHAAVVEKGGRALILPGAPGSGKSTLCAGLVSRGWRLLSDELTLISLNDGSVIPLPRPVSLKNQSIDVIREFAPGAVMSGPYVDTRKGTVALVKPPADSVTRAEQRAQAAWLVLPKFQAGALSELTSQSKAWMLMRMAENAFNYHIHGSRGFALLSGIVERCDCYGYRYSQLEDAVDVFNALADEKGSDEVLCEQRA